MNTRILLPLLLTASTLLLCCRCHRPVSAAAWHSLLPHCPCENPDRNGVLAGDGWAKDAGNIALYHPGAAECFRSYPALRTGAGLSGQQCCYDASHRLIDCGAGAGTPDMVSTCAGEDRAGRMLLRHSGLWGHWLKDVLPWEQAGGRDSGWVRYNPTHPPDTGLNCR